MLRDTAMAPALLRKPVDPVRHDVPIRCRDEANCL
jgi:hypothetical protein